MFIKAISDGFFVFIQNIKNIAPAEIYAGPVLKILAVGRSGKVSDIENWISAIEK